MASNRLGHRISLAIGGGAFIVMIGFTASCSSDSDTPEESSTTTTTTTTPSPLSPTEKAPNPNAPDDPFTPPVKAPQPTVKHPDGDGH
jgi:hypothetical protein